jgi:TPR repeat protein
MAKDHCQSCNGSAENNLGIMYRDGLGGEKNEKKARELFKKATTLN